jgi:protein-S-isoprenylcysteine O-methyltransferase Ste14
MMGDVYKVVAPPPLIFLAGLVLGLVADGVLTDSDLGGAWLVAGIVLVALGLGLLLAFEVGFRRAGTTILPGHEGSALVTGGVYRVTRNPGYVGMALVGTGAALIADAPWAILGVALAALVVDRGVIVHEERYLRERFGDEYAAYCARVRRWL